MKFFLIGLALLSLFGCSARDLQQLGLLPLTEEEVTQALKDALSRGIARSAPIPRIGTPHRAPHPCAYRYERWSKMRALPTFSPAIVAA